MVTELKEGRHLECKYCHVHIVLKEMLAVEGKQFNEKSYSMCYEYCLPIWLQQEVTISRMSHKSILLNDMHSTHCNVQNWVPGVYKLSHSLTGVLYPLPTTAPLYLPSDIAILAGM